MIDHEIDALAIKTRASEVMKVLDGMKVEKVRNETEADQAALYVLELRNIQKEFSGKANEVVEPWKFRIKDIESVSKPAIRRIEAITRELNQKIMEFHQAMARKAAELRAKELDNIKQDLPPKAKADQIIAAAKAEKTDPKKTSYREIETLEIVSIDLDVIPREFLKPDESKIKAHLKRRGNHVRGVVFRRVKKAAFK